MDGSGGGGVMRPLSLSPIFFHLYVLNDLRQNIFQIIIGWHLPATGT